MVDYLKMNGMSLVAHHLSVILHEGLVNALLICVCLDVVAFHRLEAEDFRLLPLLKFNLAIILFVMGATAFTLLISLGFSSAGFATQIGSIVFLSPVFLSMYLKVMEMKHTFS